MTLSDRLNLIITEHGLSKREFAKRLGISENYVYILTGKTDKITEISTSLAKLIAYEFGYNKEWIMTGEGPKD